MKPMSRANEFKQMLLELIRESLPDTRLPSERDLAVKYGLARGTVTKVIVELENERYVVRRHGSGTYVMPRDNKIEYAGGALEEVGSVSGEVIIAYPNFFAHTLWMMVDEAEQLAVRNNFKLTGVKLQPQTNYATLLSLVEKSTELSGVILIPISDSTFPKQVIDTLAARGCPVILLDSAYALAGATGNVYQINSNAFQTGFRMAEELLKNGHRKIGYIPNEPQTPSSQECVRGIKQALYAHKLRWKDLVKPQEHNVSWSSSINAGYELTLPLLAAHPELTALIYDTIPGAFAGLAALAKLGRRCPDDISVIAGSGMFGCEEFTVPALASVDVSRRDLVRIAVDIILAPDGNRWNRNILVDVELFRRASIREIGGAPSNLFAQTDLFNQPNHKR